MRLAYFATKMYKIVDSFSHIRVTYTHLAIRTNVPRNADRFGDTIFYMDVTYLEGKQERSYFHKVINA